MRIRSDPIQDKENKYFNEKKITYRLEDDELDELKEIYKTIFDSNSDNETIEEVLDRLSSFITISLSFDWRKKGMRQKLMT